MGGKNAKQKYEKKVDDDADAPSSGDAEVPLPAVDKSNEHEEAAARAAEALQAKDVEIDVLRLSLARAQLELQEKDKLLSSLGLLAGKEGNYAIIDPLERAALMWAQRGALDPLRTGFRAWQSIVADALRKTRAATLKLLVVELNELRKFASPDVSVVRKLELEKQVLVGQVEEFRRRFDEFLDQPAQPDRKRTKEKRFQCTSSADLAEIIQKEVVIDQAAWNLPSPLIILPQGPPVSLELDINTHLRFAGNGLQRQIAKLVVEGSANVEMNGAYLPHVLIRRGGRLALSTCKGGSIEANSNGVVFVRESSFDSIVGRGAGFIGTHLGTFASIRAFNCGITLSTTRVEGSDIALWVESGRATARGCRFVTPSACVASRGSAVLLQRCILAHPDTGVDLWLMAGGQVTLEATQADWIEQDAFSHVVSI